MGELLLTPGSTLTLASVYHRSAHRRQFGGVARKSRLLEQIEKRRVTHPGIDQS